MAITEISLVWLFKPEYALPKFTRLGRLQSGMVVSDWRWLWLQHEGAASSTFEKIPRQVFSKKDFKGHARFKKEAWPFKTSDTAWQRRPSLRTRSRPYKGPSPPQNPFLATWTWALDLQKSKKVRLHFHGFFIIQLTN